MSGMRELLGLLISVIALVLSSLARRTAHERVRPAQLPHEPPQEEPELTEVEVEAWEPVREALSQLLPGEEAEGEPPTIGKMNRRTAGNGWVPARALGAHRWKLWKD